MNTHNKTILGAQQRLNRLKNRQMSQINITHDTPLLSLPTDEVSLAKFLADPYQRIFSGALYKIMIKGDGDDETQDVSVMPFKPNAAQEKFVNRLWHRNVILKARQLGFCVSPETRILTADLQWVAIGDIAVGTEVVAVDEHTPGGRGKARRMKTATVQAVRKMQAERFRLTFDDGRTVVCTDRHPWLSRKVGTDAKWRSISGKGNEVVGKLQVGTQVRWIAKPWDQGDYEDGWFGGLLDGEGSIAKSNSSAGINVSQRPGKVWDRVLAYANSRGYNACIENDNKPERDSKFGRTPVPKLAFGRIDEMFRLIGQTRPSRFIGNRFWENRELPGKKTSVGWATITSIESLGVGEVVDMQTSAKTYIAEGFVSHNTTLIAILWLDHALFNADQRCGIIAQDREAAEVIFRDKVKFAYENLPEQIRERFPLARDSASELLFAHNNSSIRVATSMRSGTIHRLHISEFGKICAKFPDKAKEVMTGSIPAVPSNGILVIESTAEGRDGSFFKICQTAQANFAQRKKLNFRDYRFHFYAWWQEPKYRMDSSMVSISPKQHEYFDEVETIVERDMGITVKIDVDQRAWYVATIEADFEGADDRMWQEYPSYPAEAFQVSTDGNYYAKDMALLRKRGGITDVPELDMPVNTFWDIGNSDGCAIWFHQDSNGQDRFIDYYEAHGETLKHYVAKLKEKGYVFNTHYLPHDATHERLSDFNKSTLQMLQDLMPGERFIIVPRISYLMDGIQQTRACMRNYYFDQTNCKLGIDRLDGYKKRWNNTESRYVDQPDKSNGCSEGADALRQHAQAKMAGLIVSSTKTAGSDYEEDNDNDWRTM